MGKPLNLAKKTDVDKLRNSIDIAQGAKVTVEGGFVLTVGEETVDISGGNLYNCKASEKAAEMASALIMLLRNAGGTANIVAFSTPEYQKWTENVSRVMSYFGIDVSKDFTVNGMKYSKNKEGWQETLEESGVNPFSDGFSALAQLVMEQDLMTGGDDNIFGNTVESSLSAVKKVLDRNENPLGTVDENKAGSLQREKKFYSTLLRKLEKIR